jgi:hypothetical protein
MWSLSRPLSLFSLFLSLFLCSLFNFLLLDHHHHDSQEAVQNVLIDTLEPLITDPESVIRQHVASQLVHVSIVCMSETALQSRTHGSSIPNKPNSTTGYGVTVTVLDYINTLLQDRDLDVRRVAAKR